MKKPYRNIKTVLKEQIFVLWKFKRNLRMAHTCNPSYFGGRDQEDLSWKPALGKYFGRLYFRKNPSQKKAGSSSKITCLANIRP
jgi:hypothetical protein